MNTMPMKCIEKDGICHTPGECPVHCRIIDEQIDEDRSLVAPIDAKARVHYEEETREQGAGMIIALPNDGRGLRYCIIDLLGRTVHEYRDLDAALRAREGDQRIAIWQEMNAQVGLEGRWLTGWPVPDPRS